jgi:hypothetical protein
MKSDNTAPAGQCHAVRFYESQESLCKIAADFIGEGIATGKPALIVGTPEHNAGILRELKSRHFDLEAMTAAGDLLVLDARDTLSEFMMNDLPDAGRFRAWASGALDRLCRGREDCTIRAYGEMVDVLWKDGFTNAATKLEMLWNQLAASHEFSLLCGYAMGSFYKDANTEEICAHHSHIVSATGKFAPTLRSETIN